MLILRDVHHCCHDMLVFPTFRRQHHKQVRRFLHEKKHRAANLCQRRSLTCHVGLFQDRGFRTATHETPPHVVRLYRTRSQTFGFQVWLGFGGAVFGFYRCYGSSGLAQFWRRARSGLQPRSRIHSFGAWACNLHHHVAKDICARLSRNGCIPPRTPGKSNVFEFVLRNTMQVFSVMKVWGCRLSVCLCHHQRHRMMSFALAHRTTRVAVFGWGRNNRCERCLSSPRYGENGSVTRLRQHMDRAGTWTNGCGLAKLANVA